MADTKVLVIDDDEDATAYITAILEGEHAVLSARDGEAGLKRALSERPDLIILDVQMPGKDGFTTFAELREHETTRDIPVVMVTGVGRKTGIKFSKTDMGDLLGVEPEAYVEKPVDPDLLRETVTSILTA